MWSRWTSSIPTRKKRRLVSSSSSWSREPSGPTMSPATFAFTSTLKAFAREPGVTSAADPALDLDRGRALRDDDPVAVAGRALARHHLARAVGDVLARHLDEAERRDLDDVGLRAVALELLAERILDLLAVLRVRHVDEVDDDDPADVAQPELAHDLA